MRRARLPLIALSTILFCMPVAAGAVSYTVQTIDFPNTVGATTITGINNSGTVLGTYQAGYPTPTGFLYNQVSGSFTPFALPSFGRTTGINDSGQILTYGQPVQPPNNYFSQFGDPTTGNFQTISLPPSYFPNVVATGINDAGQIIGFSRRFAVSGPFFSDFLLNSVTGSIVPVQIPGLDVTLLGINNRGEVVGNYPNGLAQTNSILFNPITGVYVNIIDPNAVNGTFASAVNDLNQVIGYYVDSAQVSHNFLFDFTTNTYTDINLPIKASGGISLSGINDAGQIVGTYFGGSGLNVITDGFIATPAQASVPEPSSFLLLGAGFGGLLALGRRQAGGARHKRSLTAYGTISGAMNPVE